MDDGRIEKGITDNCKPVIRFEYNWRDGEVVAAEVRESVRWVGVKIGRWIGVEQPKIEINI